MEETLKFTLRGLTACIRKPESNSIYFTYNFPHKIMLLGLIGCIIGENGYNYNLLKNIKELPEYYLNLKNLKIGIVPNNTFGKNTHSKHTFNNSVGYASKEEGNNLIVKEQWLENPSWDIYILDDKSEKFNKIKEYILNQKCEYIPFIGKNDHFAIIENAEILNINKIDSCNKIDSIVIKEKIEVEDELEELLYEFNNNEKDIKFILNEVLPTKLDKELGYTEYKEYIYTNKKININDYENIYNINNSIISFN